MIGPMSPFFDASSCPSCRAALPIRPLRCPSCGVDLTGVTVTELVGALRLADSLVDRMRADLTAGAPPRQTPIAQHP